VFFSFVPGGVAAIQSMALALAVGVLFDALIVRMTIIPAFMWLLGDRGWWLPPALRSMPDVDIEGAVVERQREAWAWQKTLPETAGLALESKVLGVQLQARMGDVVELFAPSDEDLSTVLAAISGRGTLNGHLSVLGKPLPFESTAIRRRASLVLHGITASGVELGTFLRTQRAQDGSRTAPGDVLSLAALIAQSSGTPFTGVAVTSDMAGLTADQLWAVDAAVALSGNPELIVMDARHIVQPEKLLALITDQLPKDAIVVVGLDHEVTLSGRRVVTARLGSTVEVTA